MAAASGASSRIHYLDNLRALAMLLGVYLHGALAYAEPSRSIWIATNPQGRTTLTMMLSHSRHQGARRAVRQTISR